MCWSCETPGGFITPSLRGALATKQSILAEKLDYFASLAMTIERQVFDSAFLEKNIDFRLSNSSTLTPLRRMIRLCWHTESVLFQAQ